MSTNIVYALPQTEKVGVIYNADGPVNDSFWCFYNVIILILVLILILTLCYLLYRLTCSTKCAESVPKLLNIEKMDPDGIRNYEYKLSKSVFTPCNEPGVQYINEYVAAPQKVPNVSVPLSGSLRKIPGPVQKSTDNKLPGGPVSPISMQAIAASPVLAPSASSVSMQAPTPSPVSSIPMQAQTSAPVSSIPMQAQTSAPVSSIPMQEPTPAPAPARTSFPISRLSPATQPISSPVSKPAVQDSQNVQTTPTTSTQNMQSFPSPPQNAPFVGGYKSVLDDIIVKEDV